MMASPKTSRRTRNGREYTWKGETFPSVTTIIRGGIPSWALENWKIKQVAERAVDMCDDLPKMVERDRDAAIKFLKEAPYKARDKAASLGTSVHETVQAIIMGAPPPKALPETAPYINQFLRFEAELRPKFRASEATIFNRTYGYAGTLDTLADIDGKTWVLDYKTGSVWSDVALQLAAYRYGEFVGLADGTEQPLPDIHYGGVIHLTPETWELIPVACGPVVFDYFLTALGVWRWTQQIAKQAIGAPMASNLKEASPVFEPRQIATAGKE